MMKMIALQSLLHLLYGPRDEKNGHSLRQKCQYLGIAVFDFWQAIEKNLSSRIVGIALARLISRAISLASSLKIPILDADISDRLVLQGKKADSISLLQTAVGETNHMVLDLSGIPYIIAPIMKDYEAIASLTGVIEDSTVMADATLFLLKQKLVDMIQYSMVIANHHGVNLESSLMERYGSGCHTCKSEPCTCDEYDFTPMNWATAEA